MTLLRPLVCLLATFAAGASHAGVLGIGQNIGGANVYAFHNFSGTYSDVEGALVAGGNVTLNGYSVNANNVDAYANASGAGYALVAGGNLALANGSIKNGVAYVGGNRTVTSADTQGFTATNPVDFAAAQAYYTNLSGALANVAATGTTARNGTGISLTGSGAGVDVFNLTTAQLNGATWWQTSNLTAGQTLVFNVSGGAGYFNNMGFSQLTGYNVLFNFYQATDLNVNGVIGSILAPYATVGGSGGAVHGNLIVDNWNAGTQIDADHYFKAVDIAGLNLGPATDVPEPASIALGVAGLAALRQARRQRACRARAS